MKNLYEILLTIGKRTCSPKKVPCHVIDYGEHKFAVVRGAFVDLSRNFMKKNEDGRFATLAYVIDDENMLIVDTISSLEDISYYLHNLKKNILQNTEYFKGLMDNINRKLRIYNMSDEEFQKYQEVLDMAWKRHIEKEREEAKERERQAKELEKKRQEEEEKRINGVIEKIKTGEGFINDDDVLILLKRYDIWETIPIKTRSLFTNNSSFAGMRVNGGKITNIYQRNGYRWSDNLRKIPMRLVEKITHDINDLLEDE